MRLADLVAELDAYFRVRDVRDDDWAAAFAHCYPDPHWREHAEPGYEGRWNGLMVRGVPEVGSVVTCVFPSDEIVAGLARGTLLFSEHPLDFADRPGFLPLAPESFQLLRERAAGFYHVHAPLDQHPAVSPSRLCAEGVGLVHLEEYFPIARGLPGGAAVSGDTYLSIDGLADAFRAYLGPRIPVHVIGRPRPEAGRVAVAAGGGARRDLLEASLERGCRTYVTGNAATNCELEFVRREVAQFRALAEEAAVALIDATHYGMERPPQLAMLAWFERRGVPAAFAENGPK